MFIEKRIRFVISTAFLSLILLFSTFFFYDSAPLFIPLLVVATYGATYFALYEDIERLEWFMLFILPVLLSVSWYLFYFLFPGRWITRIPFVMGYAVSMYAVLLSSNIFNVGVEKNLQLYRAGFSVNYFFQTVVFFLFSNVIASFHWGFLANCIIYTLLAFVMALQLLWSIKLDLHIRKEVRQNALFTALIVGEGGLLLSLLPLPPAMYALAVAVLYYCVAGLTYHHLDERLFRHAVREYVVILVVIFVLLFLSLSW
jgi:hypothetical protein